ncbi:hypothetical protein BGZ97_002726 [Linnemannia gamsii]|uniref:Uncharacterized protein n=1 Tax=Linnemannia gamsii TaxID=64522 RepID=A0A9P6USP2_9FUNG|nr:hypothetical protein BGZ97_002726 [Linnemannia gamsii]
MRLPNLTAATVFAIATCIGLARDAQAAGENPEAYKQPFQIQPESISGIDFTAENHGNIKDCEVVNLICNHLIIDTIHVTNRPVIIFKAGLVASNTHIKSKPCSAKNCTNIISTVYIDMDKPCSKKPPKACKGVSVLDDAPPKSVEADSDSENTSKLEEDDNDDELSGVSMNGDDQPGDEELFLGKKHHRHHGHNGHRLHHRNRLRHHRHRHEKGPKHPWLNRCVSIGTFCGTHIFGYRFAANAVYACDKIDGKPKFTTACIGGCRNGACIIEPITTEPAIRIATKTGGPTTTTAATTDATTTTTAATTTSTATTTTTTAATKIAIIGAIASTAATTTTTAIITTTTAATTTTSTATTTTTAETTTTTAETTTTTAATKAAITAAIASTAATTTTTAAITTTTTETTTTTAETTTSTATTTTTTAAITTSTTATKTTIAETTTTTAATTTSTTVTTTATAEITTSTAATTTTTAATKTAITAALAPTAATTTTTAATTTTSNCIPLIEPLANMIHDFFTISAQLLGDEAPESVQAVLEKNITAYFDSDINGSGSAAASVAPTLPQIMAVIKDMQPSLSSTFNITDSVFQTFYDTVGAFTKAASDYAACTGAKPDCLSLVLLTGHLINIGWPILRAKLAIMFPSSIAAFDALQPTVDNIWKDLIFLNEAGLTDLSTFITDQTTGSAGAALPAPIKTILDVAKPIVGIIKNCAN